MTNAMAFSVIERMGFLLVFLRFEVGSTGPGEGVLVHPWASCLRLYMRKGRLLFHEYVIKFLLSEIDFAHLAGCEVMGCLSDTRWRRGHQ